MSKMKNFIEENMIDLCDNTDPNEVLLNRLAMQKIITEGMRATIMDTMKDTQTKNFTLYTFLKKARTDKDLDDIMTALDKSSNSGAFELFKRIHTPGQEQPDVIDHDRTLVAPTSMLLTSSAPRHQPQHLDEVDAPKISEYPNSGRKKALIINVLKNRRGAEQDTIALEETLQRCGFQVVKCQFLTERGIMDAINNFKEDLIGVTCCLVAVMSHGTGLHEFLTEDDRELHLKKDIVNSFNNVKCKQLKDMPKIFLANFCRGDAVDTGTDFGGTTSKNQIHQVDSKISTTETDSTASFSDILICYGTYDDHYAYRTGEGTWFIQSFCRTMKARADGRNDFTDIMNFVFIELSEKETEHGHKQCSPYENIGFCKKLYLKYV